MKNVVVSCDYAERAHCRELVRSRECFVAADRPEVQVVFEGIVAETAQQFQEAGDGTDLGRSVRASRGEQLGALIKAPTISDWRGWIRRIALQDNAMYRVDIALQNDGILFTNKQANLFATDIRIPADSISQRVASMSVGQEVVFSGQLDRDLTDVDVFTEHSATEVGSMRQPEYKCHITALTAYTESEPEPVAEKPADRPTPLERLRTREQRGPRD